MKNSTWPFKLPIDESNCQSYSASHSSVCSSRCLNPLLSLLLSSKGTLRSSSQYPLATPKARLKTCGERTFPVAAPGLWNSIPLGIRSSSLNNSFKRHLKTYPFKQAYHFFKFFIFYFLWYIYLIMSEVLNLVYSYIGIYIFFLSFFSFSFIIILISSAIDNIRGFSAV